MITAAGYPTREDAMERFFDVVSNAQLDGSGAFQRSARRLPNARDIASGSFPALFQFEGDDDGALYEPNYRMPTKRTYAGLLFIYTGPDVAADPMAIPATPLNRLITAVELALEPSPVEQVQTLGRYVYWARLDGAAKVVPADINTNALGFAMLPFKITMP